MSGKEFLKNTVRDFFVIVTLCNVIIFLLGTIFQQDARLGYDAFLAPILYGGLGVLPNLIMYSKRELTIKEVVVRKLIQLPVIEVMLYAVVFGRKGLRTQETCALIWFGVGVLVIYVSVHLIGWIFDAKEARMLTEDLKHFQAK